MRCAAVLALSACALSPQPPPDFATGHDRFSQGVIESVPYVPTRVVVRTPDAGDVVVRTRFESANKPELYLLGPRYRFTHRLGDRLQWGGAVGLSTLTADLRARPWDLPIATSVGGLVAVLPALAQDRLPPWEVRVLASAQPRLGPVELLLGTGLSVGKRQHDMVIPEGPLATYGVDQQVPDVLRFERHEAWLEGLVGFAFEMRQTRFTLAVQPFYVVAHGSPTLAQCAGCQNDPLVSVEASWGAAFTLSALR